jgi:hypothetical protein
MYLLLQSSGFIYRILGTVWHYDRLVFEHSGIPQQMTILLRLHVHLSVKRGTKRAELEVDVSRRHNLIPLPRIKKNHMTIAVLLVKEA